MPSKPFLTDDDKARNAAYVRTYYRRMKQDPDLALRSEVSALKTAVRRVVKRVAASKPPLHPADAEVVAATLVTLSNDSELLSTLVHPARRIAR